MKVALVHYWLVNMRGGERVLEELCEMFPNADVFTHVYSASAVSETIRRHRVKTSFIQCLPGAVRHYQKYLPLMPMALDQLDLRGYDLVISSESGPAKGVVVASDAVHLCYCHTPMRYVWDMYPDYRQEAPWFIRPLMLPIVHYLRLWDYAAAARVDHFIANSKHIAKRIARHYGRSAEVIYPPVDTEVFAPVQDREDFYLMVGQLVRYKRVDLAIEAFKGSKRRLVIIGDGDDLTWLKTRCGPNISMMGWQPAQVVRDHYARCKALIFPGEEDFGMVPVECMASGRPVIAFKKGGALETVLEGVSGVFFEHQTPESLAAAVARFEHIEPQFLPHRIVAHAQNFSRANFRQRFQQTVDRLMENTNGVLCDDRP